MDMCQLEGVNGSVWVGSCTWEGVHGKVWTRQCARGSVHGQCARGGVNKEVQTGSLYYYNKMLLRYDDDGLLQVDPQHSIQSA